MLACTYWRAIRIGAIRIALTRFTRTACLRAAAISGVMPLLPLHDKASVSSMSVRGGKDAALQPATAEQAEDPRMIIKRPNEGECYSKRSEHFVEFTHANNGARDL